jgi:prophage regulatory protein
MESRNKELASTIIRKAEVLRRTGFSASTLYLRIAKGEFPRQVSLGARSVGWIEHEIDAWIAGRVHARPGAEYETRCPEADGANRTRNDSPVQIAPQLTMTSEHSPKTGRSKGNGNLSMPDLAQVEVIEANLYVDKRTGALWFQVLSPFAQVRATAVTRCR